MDVGLKTKLQMKGSEMIKKLSLMLLVLCSLSMLSASAQSHEEPRPPRRRPEGRPQGQHYHYHLNNFRPYCPPRFVRPYGFYNYGYDGPRRGPEADFSVGGPRRRRAGCGIGCSYSGW